MYGTINTGMTYRQLMRELDEYIVSIMSGERTVLDINLTTQEGMVLCTADGVELIAVYKIKE